MESRVLQKLLHWGRQPQPRGGRVFQHDGHPALQATACNRHGRLHEHVPDLHLARVVGLEPGHAHDVGVGPERRRPARPVSGPRPGVARRPEPAEAKVPTSDVAPDAPDQRGLCHVVPYAMLH
eukprot:9067491-Lingulodinium_polyedra.AAC.1